MDRRRVLRLGALGALGVLTGCRTEQPAAAPTPGPTGSTPSAAPSPTASSTEPPSASPTETATVDPVVVPLACRAAWGARDPAGAMTPHTIGRLTVHHSAAVASDSTQGPGHLRGFQAFHMDEQGWPDIAYHVAVDRAGVVYELRDWGVVGDTGTDYDPTGHFLLLLDGNFDDHAPSEAQLASAAHVLAWAADHFGVGLDTISGHRDHASTACPGDALYARLGELHDRAAARRADGPVRLETVCGPEAAAAVAAVETGQVPPLLRS